MNLLKSKTNASFAAGPLEYPKPFHRMFRRLCLLLVAHFALGSLSPAAAASATITDEDVTQAVEKNLRIDEAVSSHLIDVDTQNGVVTLSGTVSHLLEKDRALAITESIKGVRSIIDKIEVRTPKRPDREIKEDVTDALADDPAVDTHEIDVRVDDGEVTLNGTVESWAEKLLVEHVAKTVKGVKKIKNGIDYSYESQRADSQIKADVQQRLKWDAYVDEEMIDVKVNNAIVTLTGTVGSAAEKSYAGADARVAGVRRIDTRRLEVDPEAHESMRRKTKVLGLTDTEMKNAIQKTFSYDPRVTPAAKIDIKVDNGEVTLSGAVDNLRAKKAAARDAQHTTGVWKVHNFIKIRPKDGISDSEIAQNIREALIRDPYVDRFDIDVSVRNRKAYLTGEVDALYEKRHASNLVSGLKGVADVTNNLSVKNGWVWKSDEQIERDVRSQWAWSPFVDGEALTVRAEDGLATIAGSVDDWPEADASIDNAFEGGANVVETYIRINGTETLYDSYWTDPPPEIWEF